MSRLRIAVTIVAIAVLGILPAAARATVTQSQITSWVSQTTDPQGHTTTLTNAPYLISFDNPPPTTLQVKGNAPGSQLGNLVDVACFFGSGGSVRLKSNVSITSGNNFDTGAVPLRPIAGHACRLRAVPAGQEGASDSSAFAGPQVAVSEAALPTATIADGPNVGLPYNYYVNDVTFTGWSAWKAVGTNGCGPYAAPIDPAFTVGNFAIDCAGSLLADDLHAWGGRSEIQVDGRNAYDAASAQALFDRSGGLTNGSRDLSGFPSLTASVNWDPATGLASTNSQEALVACTGSDPYKPVSAAQDCPSFADVGVKLDRDITTSDGGRVVTMTDTWSSADGRSHTVDLLYDDFIGLSSLSTVRGYSFPGQGGFNAYIAGDPVSGAGSAPGSIYVHTNVAAADGNPNEAFGAITFSNAPTGFHVTLAPPPQPQTPPPSNGIEEHVVGSVPAGGSTSLTYIYSVGYTLSDVSGLALAAQDRLQAPAVTIASPANGATVSSPTVMLAGTATAGSGIKSLVVGGQPVTVDSGGMWSAQVPLSPGANTITAVATDGAGAIVQAQVTVAYQPPAAPPAARCRVPRTKGMKLSKAERTLRRAHCRVGKIKHVKSHRLARGRVTSTTPRAGRRVPAGSKVRLFVSKGW